MEGTGTMGLAETPVGNPIVHEAGLEGIQTLVYPRIVVTLALMFHFQDTLLDDHNMSTTVGLVGISERVFTLFPEVSTCLALWST